MEAVALIRCMYSHRRFAEQTIPEIYEMMVAAATLDLHWEVKKKALEFWDDVISERLKHQGMIDENFPAVTFSKEHRKIVTLNENEIRTRLNKVLLELSANGCLKALTAAVQDDCDVDVIEKAVDVTKKFAGLLNKYNVLSSGDKFNLATRSSAGNEEVNGFLEFVQKDLNKLVENKRNWLQNMDSFGSLLDDMLREYEEDEDVNSMDCY